MSKIIRKQCLFHFNKPADFCRMCRGAGEVIACDCGATRPIAQEKEFRKTNCWNHATVPLAPMPLIKSELIAYTLTLYGVGRSFLLKDYNALILFFAVGLFMKLGELKRKQGIKS